MTRSQSLSAQTLASSHAAQELLPALWGLFEMVLEVADLTESERFYHDVIGLPIAER